MAKKIDFSIIGEEFGYLKVIAKSKTPHKKGSDTFWDCLCSLCGKTRTFRRGNLVSGNTTSCGCRFGLNKKVAAKVGLPESMVSIVMNNKWQTQQYSIKMVEKIKKAAKSLNYKPWYRRN